MQTTASYSPAIHRYTLTTQSYCATMASYRETMAVYSHANDFYIQTFNHKFFRPCRCSTKWTTPLLCLVCWQCSI